MPIAKLEAEHRRILEMADTLDTMSAGPFPEVPGEFTQKLWSFTREVMAHLSNDEALVIVPLMDDRRPHIAQLAVQSHAQLRALHADLERHMTSWHTLPAAGNWPGYRREVQTLIRRLRARVATEETGIYHFLPVQRVDRHPDLSAACTGAVSQAA
jgi:hypothetical protein